MKKPNFHPRKDKRQIPSRITNETVAEHRERILAGGRKFKYPLQYSRRRLVINTIMIVFGVLLLIAGLGWWRLYEAQASSQFAYRLTRLIPLPVAKVDGEYVRYSDYLMYYNSSEHYQQQTQDINLDSADGKRQLMYYKRQALDTVIADTYAAKLARHQNISVTDEEVDEVIINERETANGVVSQETYDASALSVLGWTPQEYREDARNKLLRQKVVFAIDVDAKRYSSEVQQQIADGVTDFKKIATHLGKSSAVIIGSPGQVPFNNRDGGLTEAASKIKKGEVKGPFKVSSEQGYGYYFIRLIDKNDRNLSYDYLEIPLKEFDQRLSNLKKDHKIEEYIEVADMPSPEEVRR